MEEIGVCFKKFLTSVKCRLIVYRKRHHSTRDTEIAKRAVEYSVFLDHMTMGKFDIAQVGFEHVERASISAVVQSHIGCF